MTIERNIRLQCGKYYVSLTRRPQTLRGGPFDDLSKARQVRDELEKTAVARKPWGVRVRMVEKRRTQQQLRMERREKGLCQSCGDEPPKPGRVTCQGCMDAMHKTRYP